VGGLTVVRALMERLPLENIVYFGDTARVPYGVKSVATIEHFTGQITDYLLDQGVKMLIIACNTMAAVASQVVKDKAGAIPVLDVIEAGARAAVAESRSRAIGVIGTPTTINSNAYARRMHALDPNVRVYSQACPLFVPLVEEGWLDHEVTRLTAQEYLKPVLAENVDTLVLGAPITRSSSRSCRMWSGRISASSIRPSPSPSRPRARSPRWASPTTAEACPPTATPSPTSRCASRPSASAFWALARHREQGGLVSQHLIPDEVVRALQVRLPPLALN
jgi:hypothetical protein